MSQLRAHRLLSIAMRRLERGEGSKSILHAIKGTVEELKDPFAGEIDDFLADKASKSGGEETDEAEETGEDAEEDPVETIEEAKEPETGNPNEDLRNDSGEEDHPQEAAEDELEEETPAGDDMPGDTPQDAPQEELEDELQDETPAVDDMPGDTPQDAPQEELEDKAEDEAEDTSEEKVDELEKRKQDLNKEIDKVQQTDDQIESALRSIAALAKKRGYPALANKFIKASRGGVVEILNNLLMKEYQQRDIAINYYYLFDDSQKSYLIEHFEAEKGRIVYLQNAIVGLGGTPSIQRLVIPPVNPLAAEGVMALNVELEKQAVVEYLAAADSLEGLAEFASLKIWLQSVAIDEQEGVVEFQQEAEE